MSGLGPDNFNCTISLNRIFCYQTSDRGFLNNADDEPYIWTFMVKIDGNSFHQPPNANYLAGEASYFFPNGSPGNLMGDNDISSGQGISIPAALGKWETSLSSIPISIAGQQITKIPGIIIAAAVFLEENLTQRSAVAAAHTSTINLIKTTVASTIASLGLVGLAADAAADFAAATVSGTPITIEAAVAGVLARRLKPITDLFTVAAESNAVYKILRSSGFGGLVGSAIDRDTVLGIWTRTFTAGELANTRVKRGDDFQDPRIRFSKDLWNMPNWAYTIYGNAWAHRRLVAKDPPSINRLEVKWTTKRKKNNAGATPQDDGFRISTISGDDNGRGETWVYDREEAAAQITGGERSFFVRGPGDHVVEVRAVLSFLQTDPDQFTSNNLKNLPNPPADGSVSNWKMVWF
jgi:hypothetical protein